MPRFARMSRASFTAPRLLPMATRPMLLVPVASMTGGGTSVRARLNLRARRSITTWYSAESSV